MGTPRFKVRSLVLLVLFVAMLLGLIVQQVRIHRLNQLVAIRQRREDELRRRAEALDWQAELQRAIAVRELQAVKAASAQPNAGN
jgi:hypothetical protein